MKIVFDGALFSEKILIGNNSFGMHRISEEIVTRTLADEEIELFFCNSTYSGVYEKNLVRYLEERLHLGNERIISKRIPAIINNDLAAVILKRINKIRRLSVPVKNLSHYDIYHSFYLGFKPNIQRSNIKKSLTLLDILPIRTNGYWKDVKRTREIIESLKGNFAVSISQYTKDDVLDFDPGLDPASIFVAPLAASPGLFYQDKNKARFEAVREKYGLPKDYILTLTSSDKRKNVGHMVLGFEKYIQEGGEDIHLVLAGNTTHSTTLLDQLGISEKTRSKIVLPGRYIDDEDLSIVYSNAIAFLFMSHYEGFGLPVLEAMQCGTPVIASNKTSIPEVVGSAGYLLDPNDLDALSHCIGVIVSSDDTRQKMSQKSLAQASLFSWDKCYQDYKHYFTSINRI